MILPTIIALHTLLTPVISQCHTLESGATFCDPHPPRGQLNSASRKAYFDQYAAALAQELTAYRTLTPDQVERLKPEIRARFEDLSK